VSVVQVHLHNCVNSRPLQSQSEDLDDTIRFGDAVSWLKSGDNNIDLE